MSCSQYAVGDTRRFEMGTPAQVWSTMSRCWTVAPTSARIIEDIDALPGVLEKIIAANGCVVHDEFLRTGRRVLGQLHFDFILEKQDIRKNQGVARSFGKT